MNFRGFFSVQNTPAPGRFVLCFAGNPPRIDEEPVGVGAGIGARSGRFRGSSFVPGPLRAPGPITNKGSLHLCNLPVALAVVQFIVVFVVGSS